MKRLDYILKKARINTTDDLFKLINKKLDKQKAILKIDLSENILNSVFNNKGVIKIRNPKNNSSFIEVYYKDMKVNLDLLINQQRHYAKEKYGIKYIKIKEAIKSTYSNNPELDIILKNREPNQAFITSLADVLYKDDKCLAEYIKAHTNLKIIKQIECKF
ncbi:MAG: hypothetical protein Q8O84_04980 [Nanoarchaeota archaeon]|nr:hypothetical protein [Nanoarchaeota archaeon]